MNENRQNQKSIGGKGHIPEADAGNSAPRKMPVLVEWIIVTVLRAAVITGAVIFFSKIMGTPLLCAAEGNSSIRRLNCSQEAQGKKILLYLWCTQGLCRGTHECIVKDGRFSVQVIGYWQQTPTVEKLNGWQYRFRFMNNDRTRNKQWIAVEYLDPPQNDSVDGDIAVWVDSGLRLTGKPILNVPDKQDFSLLNFVKAPQTDQVFMKKHGLKQMASWVGTIRIGDTVCCVYVVAMQKGRRSWKMEVVFPAAYEKGSGKTANRKSSVPVVTNEKELAEVCFHPCNAAVAGLWMGHFKIIE